MDNAADMVELQSLGMVTLIMVILFAPSSANQVYYKRPNNARLRYMYISDYTYLSLRTTNEKQH